MFFFIFLQNIIGNKFFSVLSGFYLRPADGGTCAGFFCGPAALCVFVHRHLFYVNYSVLSVIGVAETGHAAEQPHSMVDSI